MSQRWQVFQVDDMQMCTREAPIELISTFMTSLNVAVFPQAKEKEENILLHFACTLFD